MTEEYSEEKSLGPFWCLVLHLPVFEAEITSVNYESIRTGEIIQDENLRGNLRGMPLRVYRGKAQQEGGSYRDDSVIICPAQKRVGQRCEKFYRIETSIEYIGDRLRK